MNMAESSIVWPLGERKNGSLQSLSDREGYVNDESLKKSEAVVKVYKG